MAISPAAKANHDQLFGDRASILARSASGKDVNRPQLQECLRYLREEDALLIHSMDRLARNVEDMLRLVSNLTAKGVTVKFVKENLLFSADASPMNVASIARRS